MKVLVACEFSGVVRRAFDGIAGAMADQWGGDFRGSAQADLFAA